MHNSALILWLVSAMLRWTLPPAQHDAQRARYADIARDAVAVAFDDAEAPLFAGADGRMKTAALLLSIASYESAFAERVESGRVRGDKGQSWCLMQINLNGGRVALKGAGYAWAKSEDPGWGGADLADRRKCFRVGLHMARESLQLCRDLSLYTGGRCDKDEPKAKHRMRRAVALFSTLASKP